MKPRFRFYTAEREALKALVNKLGSRDVTKRQEAENALRHLPSEQVDILITLARFNPNWYWPRAVDYLLCAVMNVLVSQEAYRHPASLFLPFSEPLSPAVIAFALVLPVPAFIFLVVEEPRFQRRLLSALPLVIDSRLIGHLLTRIRWLEAKGAARLLLGGRHAESRLAALRLTLIDTIATVSPEENITLTREERRSLYSVLRCSESGVALALLELLAKIGGTQDLPRIRRLVSGAILSRAGSVVTDAAIRCAAVIEARLAANRNADTLLRASQPSAGAETLLRAAASAASDAREQLLRAANSEKEALGNRGGEAGTRRITNTASDGEKRQDETHVSRH